MTAKATVIEHPLIQHKLTLMRQTQTSTGKFRQLLKEIGMLLAYEVTRDLPLKYELIETPIAQMNAPMLAASKKMVIVSIMRAGQGLLDGILELIPSARVGHIGLYRDPTTHMAIEYYFKVPLDIEQRDALIVDPMLATGNSAVAAVDRLKVDPMLATGNSAVAAVDRLKEVNPKSIKFLCLLAAPEGIEHFHEQHSDVQIYTAAIDERLDEHGYIVPGLGDAGDGLHPATLRLYGTL